MELQVKEDAARSIYKKMEKVGCVSTSPTQPFIYRVQNPYSNNSNDNLYEPEVVAIGPYHRGKPGLKLVEELKPWYLQSLLLRKNENVETYISAAAGLEQPARNCYAEPISLSAVEFMEMLVLDACFIIEFLRKFNDKDFGDYDPILQMKWILYSLKRDLVLFENQIPFSVLCKMFDLIDGPNQHHKLIALVCFSLRKGNLYHSKWNNRSPQELTVNHLLHLSHIVSRPSSSNHFINSSPPSYPRELPVIPSATELKDANVRFRRKGPNYEYDFKNGTFKMPGLVIGDGTEKLLRNYIIYEQYFHTNQPTFVMDYMLILGCLVNTSKDVEILSDCGIIRNLLGDNQKAADIINRLGLSVTMSGYDFNYYEMFSCINDHYNKRWNRARAALKRDYFNTPWAYISFFAAVVLLLLTVVQTVFSGFQLK